MLNTDLFTFSSGTRSASQVFVTRFPTWSKMTTLRSSVLLFEELLPLFSADTCALLPLVGKRLTSPANTDSFQLAFWTPVMIWEINRLSLSFPELTDLVVHLFLFVRNFVRTGSSVILFLVSFDSAAHSESSKKQVKSDISIPFSCAPLPHPRAPWTCPLLTHPPITPRPLPWHLPLKLPPLPRPRSPRTTA